jgi:hypothetical protein
VIRRGGIVTLLGERALEECFGGISPCVRISPSREGSRAGNLVPDSKAFGTESIIISS